MFNLCYACLYNIIKQIFGVVKYQFQIFDKALEYLQTNQIDIVYAVMGLYNFIKILGHKKDIYNTLINIFNNTKAKNEEKTQ